MKKSIAKILIFTLLFNICSPIFAESTSTEPKEYTEDEFPQALEDLRRFEIITLGSLPFVTLNSTLVYSGIKYVQHDFDPAYSPNPFASKPVSEPTDFDIDKMMKEIDAKIKEIEDSKISEKEFAEILTAKLGSCDFID